MGIMRIINNLMYNRWWFLMATCIIMPMNGILLIKIVPLIPIFLILCQVGYFLRIWKWAEKGKEVSNEQ